MLVVIMNRVVRFFGVWILLDMVSVNGVDIECVISECCSLGDRCSSFVSSSDLYMFVVILIVMLIDSDS